MNREKIDRLARIVWDFHHINHKLKKADCLFVLGSHDIRVAEYAARLFFQNWAPFVIFSGGMAHSGDMLETGWEKSEAEVFADRAVELGVPSKSILLEKKARNTGENVKLTEKILREAGLPFDRIIAVQKPYMERRTMATIKIHWPDKDLIVTSPDISFENYPNREISRDEMINIMVGDLQRIIEYPELGYQIAQHVPRDVMRAYECLIEMGYRSHMI